MMNIFIMILVAIFMAGVYMMGAPSGRDARHSTENAVATSDLRTVAECASAVHNATIRGTEFDDICVEKNSIASRMICLNNAMAVTKCEVVRNKKPAYSYIVTASAPIDDTRYNDMMEIMEENYADAGTFGIFQDGTIISGGTANRRAVPKGIISDMKLENGMLVYLTQYEIPDAETEYATPDEYDLICPAGSVKTYRFGRWQCIGYNTKTDCGGDMIWNSDTMECVPDESRKPLCAQQQTAVLVDDVWECINPFPEHNCPAGMISRLDYSTLIWECVEDPNLNKTVSKCTHVNKTAVAGALGATLRVPTTSCTDCEQMVTDPDTCETACVPNPAAINNPQCYDAPTRTCSGSSRAFYFGFPDAAYTRNVTAVAGYTVPIDKNHLQNRKFNCMDCGDGVIDTELSKPPYVAICK